MAHFCVTLPSDGSGYCFPGNTIADFRSKLEIPFELLRDRWKVGLLVISYRKGHKKRFGTIQIV